MRPIHVLRVSRVSCVVCVFVFSSLASSALTGLTNEKTSACGGEKTHKVCVCVSVFFHEGACLLTKSNLVRGGVIALLYLEVEAQGMDF